MGKHSIAEIVERFLFYFSLTVSGIFKRRKMDQIRRCDVFAGEEEVTPRSISPVELPTLPVEVPPLPEGGIIPIPEGPPEHPLMQQPGEDLVPWCPMPHRRSNRKRAAPVVYTDVVANAKKSRKRMQTKRPAMKRSRMAKRRPQAPKKTKSRAQRPEMSSSSTHTTPHTPHTPMMTHDSAPNTPKSSRVVARRKPMAHSPAAQHRGATSAHSMMIPGTFIVTIEAMKKEK